MDYGAGFIPETEVPGYTGSTASQKEEPKSGLNDLGEKEDFCSAKSELAAKKGWNVIGEFVRVLWFFHFHAEDPVAAFEFANKAASVAWLEDTTKAMFALLGALAPPITIYPVRGGSRLYSPWGTRSCYYVFHDLIEQYKKGFVGAIWQTKVFERMQRIPRKGAANTFRSLSAQGSTTHIIAACFFCS